MYKTHIITPFIGCYEFTKNYLKTIRSESPYSLKLIDNKPSLKVAELFVQDGEEIFGNSENAKDCEIIYIENDPPFGVSQSWNQGIVESLKDPDCKYIFILNNDILLPNFAIDKLIEFQELTGYGLVTASNINNGENKPEDTQLLEFKGHDIRDRNSWGEEGPDFSCFMLIPSTIKSVGFFDENLSPAYFEDNDYHRRLNLTGVKCARSLNIPYFHFGSRTLNDKQNQDIVEQRVKDQAFEKVQRYFKNKWGWPIDDVMNNQRYAHPFNNSDLKPYMWKGYEKFEVIRQNINNGKLQDING